MVVGIDLILGKKIKGRQDGRKKIASQLSQ
jgi:hypothetical protein